MTNLATHDHDPKNLVSTVVRLKVGKLQQQAGTVALVSNTRAGRYCVELLIPSYPIKMWARLDEIEVVQDVQLNWWALPEVELSAE